MSGSLPGHSSRRNAAPIKVVGLGLGRTGTMSLWSGLEILGFGPCYHPMKIPAEKNDWLAWAQIAEGQSSPEAFDRILQNYQSVVDTPVAMMAAEVYAAYPDAKFIVTTRDPAKWEKSFRATVVAAYDLFINRTDISPHLMGAVRWSNAYFDGYHKGQLHTHMQQELLDHNERIKRLIPPEQLLVYEVSQGWDPLCEFLGVPKPDRPFPHLNETAWYQEKVLHPNLEVKIG